MKKIKYTIFICLMSLSGCALETSASETMQIKQLAPHGGWTWFNDERLIIDDNALYIGSLGLDGISRVDQYLLDHPQNPSNAYYPLSSWKSFDDHNNPALLKMSNGKILAAYAKHTVEKKWYTRIGRIVQPGSANQRIEWSSEQVLDLPADATYNNLFQLPAEGNRIYNFIRCIGWNPTMMTSDDDAQTWNRPVEIIKSGDSRTRPYVKYAGNGKDRIDLIYTDAHPRQAPNNNVYHMYYQAGSFRRSDGTVIRSMEQIQNAPIRPAEGTIIYRGSEAGRGWVWDLEYDAKGNPVAAFINSADHAEGNDLRYRYATWDQKTKQWIQDQIAYAGTNLYVPENHYAGGICIDPENIDIVYISCDVNPLTGLSTATGRYQIYQGKTSDKSSTWKWTQLTFDTDTDNIRPVVPRGHKDAICTIWLQGRYTTYTDYDTKIVGIISK